MNVCLIHVSNFYPKHFHLMKAYNSLHRSDAGFKQGTFHLIILYADR